MSPEQSNHVESFGRLVEYHLGLLSTGELEQTASRLEQDQELRQLSNHIEKALAPLDGYEVDIPVGLDRKIKLAIRAQKINTDTLLKDLSAHAPTTSERSIFNRWADFVGTAAAILLICSAVTLSTDHTRRQARKMLCASNLGIMGSALSAYANDYYNQLPQASTASNSTWYDSERQTPRRGNLFILVKRNYVKPEYFACPEDSSPQVAHKDFSRYNDFPSGSVVSYSFQNLHNDRAFRTRQLQLRWLNAPAMPIMADRTPLLKKNRLNPDLTSENTFSGNHTRLKGQNVLVLDGQVLWQTTPVFGPQQDNIWQAGQIRKYKGVETPVDPVDCFLAP